MAHVKLSQIATSGSDLVAADQIVAVHTGNTDLLFSGTQILNFVIGKNNTVTVTSSPEVPAATDRIILANVAGVLAVNLAAVSGRGGLALTIKDISGAASTNHITVTPNGAETIDGAATYVIQADYGALTITPLPDNSGWFIT